jgi:hypothetical protein
VLFRIAAILHGIRGRLARGSASSAHAAATAAQTTLNSEIRFGETPRRARYPARTAAQWQSRALIGRRALSACWGAGGFTGVIPSR